jgi:hypothetical protein
MALDSGTADGDRNVVPQADQRHDPLDLAFVAVGTVQPDEQRVGVVALVVQRREQALRRFVTGSCRVESRALEASDGGFGMGGRSGESGNSVHSGGSRKGGNDALD